MKTLRTAATLGAVAALLAGGCSSGDGGAVSGPGGEPLTIGVVAPLAGASALPATEYGVQAAQEYINGELGGIGGKRLEVQMCESDGTPEFVVNCANQFVAQGVPLVFDASTAAIGAAAPILSSAGIPVIGSYPATTGVENQAHGKSFYFAAGAGMHAYALVQMLEGLGAERVSLAVQASPQSRDFVDKLVTPSLAAVGIASSAQLVEPGPINAQVLAATELSSNPDAAGVISLPEEDCESLFTALRTQGFDGTMLAGPCTDFINGMGADAAGAVLQARVWSPRAKEHAPDDVKEQLEAYENAMDAVGHSQDVEESHAVAAFGGLVSMAKALDPVAGPLTAQSVTETMTQLKDFESWLLPPATCDGEQWPGTPGVCSSKELFLQVEQDGTLQPFEGDSWVDITPPTATP